MTRTARSAAASCVARIDVTLADIVGGARGSYKDCPIARALTRVLGQPARVGLTKWTIGQEPKRRLPEIAYRWRVQFDYGGQMQTFSFDVEVPMSQEYWP